MTTPPPRPASPKDLAEAGWARKARAAMRVQVECAADHRGVETPRAFSVGGRRVNVIECDDQWYGRDYRYVKVKADDGSVYILRLDEPSGEWELTMFRSPQAETVAPQSFRQK